MLERTGKDIGAAKQIYTQRAELVEFCSATLSRQVMEADARLLAFCPFGVGIYVLPEEAGHGAPGVPPAADWRGSARRCRRCERVDQLLHDIVQEAGQ